MAAPYRALLTDDEIDEAICTTRGFDQGMAVNRVAADKAWDMAQETIAALITVLEHIANGDSDADGWWVRPEKWAEDDLAAIKETQQ